MTTKKSGLLKKTKPVSYYSKQADKIKTCKKCSSVDIYKNGFCYEHYKEYAREYRQKNQDKFRQYEINKNKNAKTRKCEECGVEFNRYYVGKFCSRKCRGDNISRTKIRNGENNPSYRNGNYTKDNLTKNKKTTNLHLSACRRYRTFFRKNNDYDYCELCGTSNSLKFETHHIIFASEAPKHKELHNFKNLIYLCINCHNELHKHKILRNKLVEKRQLNDLFGRNLIVYEKKDINKTTIS